MPPKREGSASRQPGNQQFSFVTFQHPSGAKDDNARREVRSHVTTLQHRLSRQKRHAAREEAYQELQRRNQGLGQPILPHPAPAAPKEDVLEEGSSTVLQDASQSRTHQAESSRSLRQSGFSKFYSVDPSLKKAGKSRAASPGPHTSTTKSSKRPFREKIQTEILEYNLRAEESTELEQEDEHSADTALEEISNKALTQARLQQRSREGPYGDGISTQFDVSSKYARVALLDDPSDSVANVLRRLRLDFSSVIDHYQWIVRAQSPDFERQFMPDRPPRYGYTTMVTGVAQDPAFVAAAALISAGHILAIRNSPMSQVVAQGVGRLRSLVLNTINTALRDPKRACSDPLLCAVLIMASHEGLQGSTQSYHIHMKGLVQMINMRGGLDGVNDVQPFVSSLIAWQDTNVSTILGIPPYHKMAKGAENAPIVRPNPMMWLLRDV